MNKVFLMGNLTRDPELKYSAGSNTPIVHFTIAVSRRFKRDGDPEADFFSCTAFNKTAEFISKYFSKGKKILIMGRAQQNDYTNKNGEKVYSVQIIVEEAEFTDKKTEAPEQTPQQPQQDFVDVPEGAQGDVPFFQ